jgi:branched-chain amino acid transport system ATP-binding protein
VAGAEHVSAQPALVVRGLTTGYGETTIVRDVDLEVARGETFVIVGPNGHGKTTLLRAVSGLLRARGAEIELEGRRIDGLAAERRAELGLVHIPQGDHLFGELTIEENLLMGAFPRGAWGRRGAALEHAYAVFPALRERRGQRTRTLSGGERRQVAIARGLMRDPAVLIIDEPSLGLAPVIIEAVYAAIAEIAARDIAILLVEENFAHIETLADRVAVLEMGRIVHAGPPAELAADPRLAHAYLGALPS